MKTITIEPVNRVAGHPSYLVTTPVGAFERESIESARELAKTQAKIHGLKVVTKRMKHPEEKKSKKINYRTLAARVFPGWENEQVFVNRLMKIRAAGRPNVTAVELVKEAGFAAGLGSSDMSQEFGGTLGK